MNKRIEKVRDDIRLAEDKLREIQEHLKALRIREKQLCDEEILKSMRSMAGRDGDVIALLEKFQKAELNKVYDSYHRTSNNSKESEKETDLAKLENQEGDIDEE